MCRLFHGGVEIYRAHPRTTHVTEFGEVLMRRMRSGETNALSPIKIVYGVLLFGSPMRGGVSVCRTHEAAVKKVRGVGVYT
jgi:hypothetical protein